MGSAVGLLHDKFVFGRRVEVLSSLIARAIPPNSRVLDVGCGDGTIDQRLLQIRPDLSIEGIDVLSRPNAKIPIRTFDGASVPFPDASFDVVLLVDVLHHTDDPLELIREAVRVGKVLVLKDHIRQGFLAGTTLRAMDWVGNSRHGVRLPYNYWTPKQWQDGFVRAGVEVIEIEKRLGLYPPPASFLFERKLHFLAKIGRSKHSSS